MHCIARTPTGMVSTFWHAVAVRRAMLMQLSEGDFGWASEQGYPAFLAHFGNLELKLAIAAEGAKAAERAKVKRLSFAKESGAASTQFNWVFGTKFMKAAGCTQARTVSHECLFPREGGGGAR